MKQISENNPAFLRGDAPQHDQHRPSGEDSRFHRLDPQHRQERPAEDPRDDRRARADGEGPHLHQEGAGAPQDPEAGAAGDQREDREEPARVLPQGGAQGDQGRARPAHRREELRLPEVQGQDRVLQVRGRGQGAGRAGAREVQPHGPQLERVHRDAQLARPRDLASLEGRRSPGTSTSRRPRGCSRPITTASRT